MRQDFLDIVQKLKANGDNVAISVTDTDTLKKIQVATYGNDLIAEYGSIENFFETIKRNHNNVAIQEYKKNGSGMKSVGVLTKFTFSEKTHQSKPVVYEPTQTPVNPFGLAGTGLGFADIMALNTDSVLKAKLEERNTYLEQRVKELESQVYELKEEKLESKYNSDSKSSQNELIATLIKSAPALMGMFQSNSSAGLNAPQGQNLNLSEVKTELVGFISNPAFSDAMAEVLCSVIEKITTVEGFYDNLDILLNPKDKTNEPE